MLTLRRDLYQISREYGINLSKLLENALIQLLETQNNPFSLVKVSFREKKSSVGRAGLIPRRVQVQRFGSKTAGETL